MRCPSVGASFAAQQLLRPLKKKSVNPRVHRVCCLELRCATNNTPPFTATSSNYDSSTHYLRNHTQLMRNNLNITHEPACSAETGKQSFPSFVCNCQVYIARLQLLAAMVTEAKPAQSASNSLTVHLKDVPCSGWCPT